jgi:hypothetical protein
MYKECTNNKKKIKNKKVANRTDQQLLKQTTTTRIEGKDRWRGEKGKRRDEGCLCLYNYVSLRDKPVYSPNSQACGR